MERTEMYSALTIFKFGGNYRQYQNALKGRSI